MKTSYTKLDGFWIAVISAVWQQRCALCRSRSAGVDSDRSWRSSTAGSRCRTRSEYFWSEKES